ncbi:MAG: hypothetical protein ACRDOY_11065 [Nocardioidaceae bacterium]
MTTTIWTDSTQSPATRRRILVGTSARGVVMCDNAHGPQGTSLSDFPARPFATRLQVSNLEGVRAWSPPVY